MPAFPRRSIDSFRNEARRWLTALRAGDADALDRLRRFRPGATTDASLRDVQLALAREHGFDGWTALKRALTPDPARAAVTLAEYEAMAATLLEAYRTGTPEAMERHYRHTWHRRAWDGMRRYVQLDLGKRPAAPGDDVAITLDDARWLAARERGFEDWTALRASVARLPAAAPLILTPLQARAQALRDALEREDATELDLGGMGDIGDDDLRGVGRRRMLERVNLAGTSVTDAGIAHLRGCDSLRHVNLAWTRTGDGAIRALAGKARLGSFYSGVGVTDEGIGALHDWPVFKAWQGGEEMHALLGYESSPNFLVLKGPFTDRGLERLRGLDGLYGLNLDHPRLTITPACLPALAELPRLASLAVPATEAWMPGLAALPHLRYLGIQDTTAGDDGFVALARSRTIERIWGRHCHNLGTRGFRALADMPALHGLAVSLLNVGDEGLAALPRFPALRELAPIDAADAGYRHIGRCVELQSLVLVYCRETTDAATEHLADLPRLTTYFNSYTLITDRTPEILPGLDSLERITFDTCHALTDGGIARLARLPRLRELHVSGRGITPAVAQPFALSVKVTRST